MNFCDGRGYGVLVVNKTGCDGPTFDVEAMVSPMCKTIGKIRSRESELHAWEKT
jgi:hypothetical protein